MKKNLAIVYAMYCALICSSLFGAVFEGRTPNQALSAANVQQGVCGPQNGAPSGSMGACVQVGNTPCQIVDIYTVNCDSPGTGSCDTTPITVVNATGRCAYTQPIPTQANCLCVF